MKRYLSAVVLLCSVSLLVLSLRHTSGTARYSDLLIRKTDMEKIKNTRSQTSRELLTGLTFNNIPSFYDELTGSWFYSVFSGDTETDPAVGYSTSEQSVCIAFSGQLHPGESTEFIAYNENEYKTYTMAVTTLPLIRISCGDEFFQIMDFDWENYPERNMRDEIIPMTFTLIDNRPTATQPVTVSNGSIHIRGASTAWFPKKGFRLSLYEKSAGKEQKENNTALLGLRKDGDWLLYTAYNDPEKVRNVFTSNLWKNSCAKDNSFGLDFGMEYRYVELFINQKYWGLYAFGYPIDANQANIRPDNQGHYEEFLFKQSAFGPKTHNLEEGYDGLILQFDASGADLNNGLFLLKMYFNQLENGASGRFWYNDVLNIIDIWLLTKLGQAYDTVRIPGMTKNMMVAIKQSDESYKFLFAPWDMDAYWGNICSNDVDKLIIPYALETDDNSYENTVNPISVLRGSDPSINALIREQYNKLRSDGWSDQMIDELLDGFERDIYDSGAYVRDMKRWPDGNYQDPALKLSLFRDYVHKRFRSMDEYIAGL